MCTCNVRKREKACEIDLFSALSELTLSVYECMQLLECVCRAGGCTWMQAHTHTEGLLSPELVQNVCIFTCVR